MRAALFIASVALLLAGCGLDYGGDCPEPVVVPLETGVYPRSSSSGEARHGFPHPGLAAELEIDRAAGLVWVRGTTTDGEPYVERWRIRGAVR